MSKIVAITLPALLIQLGEPGIKLLTESVHHPCGNRPGPVEIAPVLDERYGHAPLPGFEPHSVGQSFQRIYFDAT